MQYMPTVASMALIRSPERALALAALLCAANAAFGASIFCCESDRGHPICGGTLPAQCFDRAYREIAPNGQVIDFESPAEIRRQAEAREQEERERLAERQRNRQQALIDLALLETYPSLAQLNRQEAETLAAMEKVVAGHEARIDSLQEQLLDLMSRIERTGNPPSVAQQAEIRELEGRIDTERSVRAVRQREADTTRKRFAEDRRRYVELVEQGRARAE